MYLYFIHTINQLKVGEQNMFLNHYVSIYNIILLESILFEISKNLNIIFIFLIIYNLHKIIHRNQ